MGHHHWKKAVLRNDTISNNRTTIGLFTRCITVFDISGENCVPNLFPRGSNCTLVQCSYRDGFDYCSCDYLPSTKGIAACAIIASILLGLAIIILFIHSINTSETRTVGLCLGILPLILLLLTFIFILITLILVGSYLSRDIMEMMNNVIPSRFN